MKKSEKNFLKPARQHVRLVDARYVRGSGPRCGRSWTCSTAWGAADAAFQLERRKQAAHGCSRPLPVIIGVGIPILRISRASWTMHGCRALLTVCCLFAVFDSTTGIRGTAPSARIPARLVIWALVSAEKTLQCLNKLVILAASVAGGSCGSSVSSAAEPPERSIRFILCNLSRGRTC